MLPAGERIHQIPVALGALIHLPGHHILMAEQPPQEGQLRVAALLYTAPLYSATRSWPKASGSASFATMVARTSCPSRMVSDRPSLREYTLWAVIPPLAAPVELVNQSDCVFRTSHWPAFVALIPSSGTLRTVEGRSVTVPALGVHRAQHIAGVVVELFIYTTTVA